MKKKTIIKKMILTAACVMLPMTMPLFSMAVSTETGEEKTIEEKAVEAVQEMEELISSQTAIDEALQAEAENDYSFDAPMVILNPYGVSPLSAVAIFTTEEEQGVQIIVHGKSSENDVIGSFEPAIQHIVPIYGLYSGDTTEVELILEDGSSTGFEIETEAVDIGGCDISVEMLDAEAYDYQNMTFVCSTGGPMYLVDAAGDIRWYYTAGGSLGVHLLKNGHLMTPTSYLMYGTYYKSGLQEIDLSGKIYRAYEIPGGMHHDFQEMPNGNILVAAEDADFSSVEDVAVEIDRETGEVVWSVDMKDILDREDGESLTMQTDGSAEIDWFHNNSLWYDEKNDLVLLSGRHKDAIVAVNHSDGSIAWILGNPEGWKKTDASLFFTPEGEEFEWFYGQHQVSMLDNGDIMLFDNGSAKTKDAEVQAPVSGDEVYSRAVVYHIDTDTMTASQVFSYGKERGPEWYSDWISGSVSLDGTQDNLWITAGSNLYDPESDSHDFGPTGMFKEGTIKTSHLDQVIKGELAYELVISGEDFRALVFRSFRMPLYLEGAGLDIYAKGEMFGAPSPKGE